MSPTTKTRQASSGTRPSVLPGDYEGNPVGLPDDACREIGPQLDRHLGALVVLHHQYLKHHWLVEGPQFRDLHLFFQEHYTEIYAQIDVVAERLTAIGFVPTSGPAAQEKLSYLKPEAEGFFPIRRMLEHDLDAEAELCMNLRETIKACIEHSDFGTKKILEDILLAAEDRAHHIEHFLETDSLEEGRE